jgi:IS30 family transposase
MIEQLGLVSLSGVARILGTCEHTARREQKRGAITPVTFVDNKPLYSAAQAEALRVRREAERAKRVRARSAA